MFRKTKFPIRNIKFAAVALILVFNILACSQGYVSQYDLTATALFSEDTLPTQPVLSGTLLATDGLISTEPVVVTPDPAKTEVILTATPTIPSGTPLPPILYYTQAGDTLPAIAFRFGVGVEDISSTEDIPARGLINAGRLLIIPNRLGVTGQGGLLIPDSDVVYSPSALDFDISTYLVSAGGYFGTYKEYLAEGWMTGAQVVQKVATESSINPRVLVALVEFQSHWVYGQPETQNAIDYPIGYIRPDKKGLYKQLNWAVQQLMVGYYGWRNGILSDVQFADGSTLRMAPQLNAGSAAVQYLLSKINNPDQWNDALYGSDNFSTIFVSMYGDLWQRAQTVEPLLPVNLTQPEMILPFLPGHTWSFTGGPHSAWGTDSAIAALDFAPSSVVSGCTDSDDWVTAVAGGVVVRTDTGVVILDLDGDGYEQTGWNILYLHIKTDGKVKEGTIVQQGDLIGHPSCEGGSATGTHVHIARKYNGEWVLADGALPFTLSGWQVIAGTKQYQGKLIKDDQVVEACDCGSFETRITRPVGGQ